MMEELLCSRVGQGTKERMSLRYCSQLALSRGAAQYSRMAVPTFARSYSQGKPLDDREHDFENMAVREHEKRMMEELRKELAAEKAKNQKLQETVDKKLDGLEKLLKEKK
mmetsp:Transcript_8812/g.36569  ORF Transcript_8812/g.36569 Transcript_8812/m.36569 type:complete len:110 (+) Transcript_8812:3-332(+)